MLNEYNSVLKESPRSDQFVTELHRPASGGSTTAGGSDENQTAVSETSLHSLVACYNEATSWYTRQQILSIIAKDKTNEQLTVISLLISVND